MVVPLWLLHENEGAPLVGALTGHCFSVGCNDCPKKEEKKEREKRATLERKTKGDEACERMARPNHLSHFAKLHF